VQENQRGLWKKWRTVLIITLCWVMFTSISFISQYFFIYDLIALKKLSGSFPFWGEFIGSIVSGIFAEMRKTFRHCDFAVKNAHCTIILS
jgi:hypothetical protein